MKFLKYSVLAISLVVWLSAHDVSGAMAPSVLSPGSLKGVNAAKKLFLKAINDVLRKFNVTSSGTTQTIVNAVINRTSSMGSFKDVVDMNSTITYGIKQLNITLGSDLVTDTFRTLNYDSFQLDLNKAAQFIGDFQTRMTANATTNKWFQPFNANLTQNQVNALAVAFEIPDNSDIKNQLIDNTYKILSSKPGLVLSFENAFSDPNYRWNSSDLIAMQPVLKQITCFYLKKVDFTDLMTNWLSVRNIDSVVFERLCKCDMFFTSNAVKGGFNLKDELKGVIGDYIVKYLQSVGFTSAASIIDYSAGFISFVPASTLERLLNIDVSSGLYLFERYAVQQSYMSYSKEWRVVIAQTVAKYLSNIGSRAWTKNETDMFTTVVLDMNFETAVKIMDLNNNYQSVLPRTDLTSKQFWLDNRDLCNKYFDYLASKSVATNDPQITLARLKQVAFCKKSCDFSIYLSGKNTSDTIKFAKEILPVLDTDVACTCRNTFGKLLRSCANVSSCTVADISQSTGNLTIPLCALYNSDEISKFQKTLLDAIFTAVKDTRIDFETAKGIIKKNAPANATASQVKNFIVAASLDYISSRSDKEIADIITTVLDRCGDFKDLNILSALLKKYLNYVDSQKKLKDGVLNIINYNNTACYDSIDVTQFTNANLNITELSVSVLNKLPKKLLLKLASQVSAVSNVDSTNYENYPLKALNIMDLISLASKDDILDLISKIKTDGLTSIQLKALYDALYAAAIKFNISNPFMYLTDSILARIDPLLFIEINDGNLTLLAQSPAFQSTIKRIALSAKDRCRDFSRAALDRFAAAASKYLGLDVKTSLNTSDLDTVGELLSLRFSVNTIKKIDAKSFFNKIELFKTPCFQLTASDANAFSGYLDNAYSAVKTSVSLAKLGNLIIYLSSTTISSLSQDELRKIAPSVLKEIQDRNDPTTSAVSEERKKANTTSSDDSDNASRVKTAVDALIKAGQTSASVSGKRKRQATQKLTCDSIKSQTSDTGYGASSYSVTDLTSLSQDDFENCLSIFGNKSNGWDDTQITAFYNKIKSLYPNLSTMSPSVVSNLGIIATKFSATELSQLNLGTLDAISNIGKISDFTADQTNSLVSNLKTSGQQVTNSSIVTSMGNLVCGLSKTDIDGIPTTTFRDSLNTMSTISASNCNSLSNLWTKLKTLNNDSYSAANIAAAGSIASGMSPTELTNNMNAASVNALSGSALQIMPSSLKSAILSNPALAAGLDTSQSTVVADKASGTVISQIQSSGNNAFKIILNPLLLLIAVFAALI